MDLARFESFLLTSTATIGILPRKSSRYLPIALQPQVQLSMRWGPPDPPPAGPPDPPPAGPPDPKEGGVQEPTGRAAAAHGTSVLEADVIACTKLRKCSL